MRTFEEVVKLQTENEVPAITVVHDVVSYVKHYENKVILGLKHLIPVYKKDENEDWVLETTRTIFVMRGQVLATLSEQLDPTVMLAVSKSNMLLSLVLMGANIVFGWHELEIGEHENLITEEKFTLTDHKIIDIIVGNIKVKPINKIVEKAVEETITKLMLDDMMKSFSDDSKKDNSDVLTNTELAI